jgi:hypothetical protein
MTLAGALALTLSVHGPPALEPAAARVRAIDRQELAAALRAAGLDAPDAVEVTLIADDEERARSFPRWIVGAAFGTRDVVILPERTGRYPYDTVESVLRHEIVHLALTARAGGRPLPRWFHEGVATSVEAGWSAGDQLRLLVAILAGPRIPDIARLFQSDSQPDTALAYLLAAALVSDVRERHGAAVPGAIAARVAGDVPFARAFSLETGETPDAAAARAWRAYRRWSAWMPALTSPASAWTLILLLAFGAYVARRRQRARRRRQWEDEGTD